MPAANMHFTAHGLCTLYAALAATRRPTAARSRPSTRSSCRQRAAMRRAATRRRPAPAAPARARRAAHAAAAAHGRPTPRAPTPPRARPRPPCACRALAARTPPICVPPPPPPRTHAAPRPGRRRRPCAAAQADGTAERGQPGAGRAALLELGDAGRLGFVGMANSLGLAHPAKSGWRWSLVNELTLHECDLRARPYRDALGYAQPAWDASGCRTTRTSEARGRLAPPPAPCSSSGLCALRTHRGCGFVFDAMLASNEL